MVAVTPRFSAHPYNSVSADKLSRTCLSPNEGGYLNADRYAEDGRLLYGAYDGPLTARRAARQVPVKRIWIAAVLAVLPISALPHWGASWNPEGLATADAQVIT